jgi:hypothetical protein
VERREHPVAVCVQFATMRFDEQAERVSVPRARGLEQAQLLRVGFGPRRRHD